MARYFLLIVLSFVICSTSFAQRSITGKVIAADTRKPIALANVFLSSTSIGTVTAENGEFTLSRFPEGRFDLVVSFIGFETYKITLQSDKLPLNFEIKLQPKVVELQEVIVDSFDKAGWSKWGNIFLDNFMGTSAFAEDCKLFNWQSVRFRFNKEQNSISATADEQLIIENNAFGYLLKYSLTRFEYDLTNRIFLYQGYPLFEEMQTTRKSLRARWMKNRQEAYLGSLMHFMRSLFRFELLKEQFEVRKIIPVSEEEIKHVKALYEMQSKPGYIKRKTIIIDASTNFTVDMKMGFDNPDSVAYYKAVLKQGAYSHLVMTATDSIAFRSDSNMVIMEFDDRLQIIYHPKKNPLAYQKYVPRSEMYSALTSEITLRPGKLVQVFANGSYFEGINFITSGYWAWWEKMCNKLPYDYWPPQK